MLQFAESGEVSIDSKLFSVQSRSIFCMYIYCTLSSMYTSKYYFVLFHSDYLFILMYVCSTHIHTDHTCVCAAPFLFILYFPTDTQPPPLSFSEVSL
jgi:hypothetical protein